MQTITLVELQDATVMIIFKVIAFRIPTAHDFRVISARKLARASTKRQKFPSSQAR